MNILPNTTESYHPGNRTGISAACAARGVTVWDTSAWIDPATDTSDGLHPNATGHGKIVTQILANLAAPPVAPALAGLKPIRHGARRWL
jgi:hypothetical protein